MKKIILLAMIIGSLTGCASVPPLNFSTPNVGVSQKKIDAEIKSLTVSLARPDEQKGDITAGMEAITPIWRESLQEALDRMTIFRDSSPNTVSLNVKVLALDVPAFGVSMTTKEGANKQVISSQADSLIKISRIWADFFPANTSNQPI